MIADGGLGQQQRRQEAARSWKRDDLSVRTQFSDEEVWLMELKKQERQIKSSRMTGAVVSLAEMLLHQDAESGEVRGARAEVIKQLELLLNTAADLVTREGNAYSDQPGLASRDVMPIATVVGFLRTWGAPTTKLLDELELAVSSLFRVVSDCALSVATDDAFYEVIIDFWDACSRLCSPAFEIAETMPPLSAEDLLCYEEL